MLEILSLDAISEVVAPWLAAAFAIATAVFAEQAFRASTQASPPDEWRGGSGIIIDFDHSEEIQERSGRDTMRSRAAAIQSVATFLGAGAAVEAAAAAQKGWLLSFLTILGVVVALVPSGLRWHKASTEIRATKAWYVRLSWDIGRKYVSTHDPVQEDAAFAKDHPRQAAALKRKY